jgi:hypothetical protein
VETRLKGYKYFEIERDLFNKLVLDKHSDVRKKDKLLKFFKLVQDGKFPLNNIASELFFDIVEWFDFFGPDINRMKRPPNNFLPNQKNWRVDGEYLI